MNNYNIRQLKDQNENLNKHVLKLRKENEILKEKNSAFKNESANEYYLKKFEVAENEIIELIQKNDALTKKAQDKDKQIFLLQEKISNLTVSNDVCKNDYEIKIELLEKENKRLKEQLVASVKTIM
ncbi:hypothetical protein C2G38_2214734 [Gigaspora rosea]|uniref:Uncharacterized protein n=1 Tax=Gigaspora rosea TaxID=44941 RepID=A0A397UAK6_9GLOM|nr:hypothetical protein C2G38_2214734 [Gigaspora rosea]